MSYVLKCEGKFEERWLDDDYRWRGREFARIFWSKETAEQTIRELKDDAPGPLTAEPVTEKGKKK